MAREKPGTLTAESSKKHPGFTEGGKFYWSEAPVTNAITNWIRRMVVRIPNEHLSPADVIGQLRDEPDWIRGCFDPATIGNWASFERFWQWPMVHAGSSFARCLKDFGRGYPVWLSNEREWTRMCDGAEKRHGYESRFGQIVNGDTSELIGLLSDKLEIIK